MRARRYLHTKIVEMTYSRLTVRQHGLMNHY